MVENFIFCIQHYGKILSAARSFFPVANLPIEIRRSISTVHFQERDIGVADTLTEGVQILETDFKNGF